MHTCPPWTSPPPSTRRALYLKHLVLNAISANVSLSAFTSTATSPAAAGATGASSPTAPMPYSDPSPSTPDAPSTASFQHAMTVSMGALGGMFSSFTRAPIRLNGLELVNVLASPGEVASRLGAHYVAGSFSALATSLGSLDVLGSPLQVVSALGTGMRDFFIEPAEATTLAGFSRSIAAGGVSLVGNTVAGVGLGVSSFTSSVSRSVAALAFDESYTRGRTERLVSSRSRPNNAALGFLEGTKDLGRGIVEGVAGVVLDPLRGAEAGGVGGFLAGLGKGVAGLVVKPVAGVLDFTTQATDGLIATAKQLTRAAGGHETEAGGGGANGAGALARRFRHRRLNWGLERGCIPVETLHATLREVIRVCMEGELEAAARAAAVERAEVLKRSMAGVRLQGMFKGKAAGGGGGAGAQRCSCSCSSCAGAGGLCWAGG